MAAFMLFTIGHYYNLVRSKIVCKITFTTMLFTGRYYNYDSSTNSHHDSIHADQLAGYWFLKASGIPDDTVRHFLVVTFYYYISFVSKKLARQLVVTEFCYA